MKRLIDYIRNIFKKKTLFNDLPYKYQKLYIEKNKVPLYYIYSSALWENHLNNTLTYDRYAKCLYDDDEFIGFCFIYLEDEFVFI